jgi:hypothetical protein
MDDDTDRKPSECANAGGPGIQDRRRFFCASGRGLILSGAADGDLRAGFAIDVGDSERPERDELHSGDELGREGGQELPMKAEKVSEQAADTEVDDVVWGGCAAFEDEGKDGNLEDVGENSEDHGDTQTRTGGDFDGSVIEVSGRGHGSHR